MEFRYQVTVNTDTQEHADQVIAERIGPDEDYGFDYTIAEQTRPTKRTVLLIESRGGVSDTEVFYGDVEQVSIDWDDVPESREGAIDVLARVRASSLPDRVKQRITEFVGEVWPDLTARYTARFSPQAWVRDNAIEVDAEGPTEWDCTEAFNDLPYDYRARMVGEMDEAHDDEALDNDDMLKDDDNAPEWVREWRGPFSIWVRPDPYWRGHVQEATGR